MDFQSIVVYLELPNFKKDEDDLKPYFDKWTYVLKNLHHLQDRSVELQEGAFKKLFPEAEIAKLKPEDMITYQESLKTYRDNQNTTAHAESEGMKKGLKKGLEKGLKKGPKEGEMNSKIEIAKNLKKIKMDIAIIAKSTGLTQEQIEKL